MLTKCVLWHCHQISNQFYSLFCIKTYARRSFTARTLIFSLSFSLALWVCVCVFSCICLSRFFKNIPICIYTLCTIYNNRTIAHIWADTKIFVIIVDVVVLLRSNDYYNSLQTLQGTWAQSVWLVAHTNYVCVSIILHTLGWYCNNITIQNTK